MRTLAVERRVEHPGSEETKMQNALRYEGATMSKQFRRGSQWSVSQITANMWANPGRPL